MVAPVSVVVDGPDGEFVVVLPHALPAQRWVAAAVVLEDARRGGSLAGGMGWPEGEPLACRCGQDAVDRLWVRLVPAPKVVCSGCQERPLRVEVGATVSFLLADSDLSRFCPAGVDLRDVMLSGTVERLLPMGREVEVRVEGWPVPHCVGVAFLAERPAGLDDLRDLMPGVPEDELACRLETLRGLGKFTVVRGAPDDFWGEDE